MTKYEINEITCQVPLDYQKPSGKKIEIFAREIFLAKNRNKPVLVFLQGGPGLYAPRNWAEFDWAHEILKHFRLVLLDQRGTGRSQKIDLNTALLQKSSTQIAEYLTHFRADNIARDVEFLRERKFQQKQIFILGQSFGGFVAVHYLCQFPQSLAGVLITCGVPPLMINSVDEVYQPLFKGLHRRNQEFYQQYPKRRDTVRRIVDLLQAQPLKIAGELFTAERFLDLGWELGGEGGDVLLDQLLEDAFTDASKRQVSWSFAKTCMQTFAYWDINPVYAFLHEAIYCDGFASNWAADRVKSSYNDFALSAKTPFFSGEMVRRTMFKDYSGLKPFAVAANLLAKKRWEPLYDLAALANNKVPVEILISKKDFYCDYARSLHSAQLIANAHIWQHATYEHDALRKHGKIVMQTMLRRLLRRVKK